VLAGLTVYASSGADERHMFFELLSVWGCSHLGVCRGGPGGPHGGQGRRRRHGAAGRAGEPREVGGGARRGAVHVQEQVDALLEVMFLNQNIVFLRISMNFQNDTAKGTIYLDWFAEVHFSSWPETAPATSSPARGRAVRPSPLPTSRCAGPHSGPAHRGDGPHLHLTPWSHISHAWASVCATLLQRKCLYGCCPVQTNAGRQERGAGGIA